MSAETRGMTLKEYCIRSRRAELLQQWHYTKNDGLTPDAVTCHSRQKVWWIDRLGHEWQQEIYSRTALCRGCPFCAGREVLAGFNDLASTHPALSAQWDREKNFDLTPQMVMAGNSRKVWWRCPKGHSWRAAVYSRTTLGTGCPVCTGRQALAGENDLATLYPDIAAQWDEEKNGVLHPNNVTAGSNRRVWWKCEKGHSYRAMIAQRVQRGDGCPYCANRKVLPGFNDLATAAPLVAKQWHESLNGALTPEMVTAGSHKKAWWRCSYGHVWKATIYSRAGVQQCGCPVCAGKTRRKTK